jgi:NET1-associated nuclear protein 1 (U3 small nucleolar RNA-associated protein 17)
VHFEQSPAYVGELGKALSPNMSPSGKRDAVTAFDGTTEGTPHPVKRRRNQKRPKKQEENAGALVQEGISSAVQDVNQEPQKTIETSLSKNTEQSTSPILEDILPLATHTDNVTPKRSKTKSQPAIRTPLKVSNPRQRADKSTKRLREPNELLNTKGNVDAASRLVQSPKQVRGKQVGESTQLVSRRARSSKKKLKPVETSQHDTPRKPEVNENVWSVVPTSGGTFIDQDPVLTDDEQHLILPTDSEIQVYSTKTSLRVRSLRVNSKSTIMSCALSTIDRDRLYVSCSDGQISIWDWTSGSSIAKFNGSKCVRQIIPLQSQEANEAILLLQDDGIGSSNLVIYLADMSRRKFTEKETVLRGSALSPCVRSYGQGRVLVACTADKLLVGQSQLVEGGKLEFSYTWRELIVPGPITSLDAQLNSGNSKTSRKVPYLDVVVGLDDGAMMHYEDILFKLIGKEKKNKTSAADITARKLHWHRTAVNTVKWSRDGNYIISGGDETVLVIWQLDSNQKQFLPHLSTPILNLTVSAVGSAYALRLADNSVMILSTADLLPSTNVTGLALGQPSQSSSTLLLHPRTPNRLLAAVPCDSFHNKPTNFLQIYDIDTSLQLTRQALARNMITASNVAPTGQPVREPSVTYMDLSHDGKWLATIDQWTPHEQDLDAMYVSSDDENLRGRATETCLRLWLWNESSDNFEQVTRIDEPHKPGPNAVLGLHFNPTRLELATTGADANVCIWTAKPRRRDGVPVRNSANDQLYTWTSSQVIHGDDNALPNNGTATSAALAYADDGSVIAASWSFPTPPAHSDTQSLARPRFVHLIDPSSGNIALSIPSLLSDGHAKLLFYGRYLLALSSRLSIFDTIPCREVPCPLRLEDAYTPRMSNAPMFLVRNKFDGSVAVGMGKSDGSRGCKVSVLNFNDTTASRGSASAEAGVGVNVKLVYQKQFAGILKGLLALTTGPGYLMVDERNQTRVLRQSGTAKGAMAITGVSASGLGRAEPEEVTRSLDSIFGRRPASVMQGENRAVIDDRNAARGLLAAPEDEKATQMQMQTETAAGGLNGVLQFASSAMAPSPAELFQRVVSVMARG